MKKTLFLRVTNLGVVIFAFMVLVLMVDVALFLPSVYAERPVINSVWANKPPSMDGMFTPDEWPESPQIAFTVPPYNNSYLNASVYVTNDNAKLYVMVDAFGDRTDNWGDENLIVFPSAWVEFWGQGGTVCTKLTGNCHIPKGVMGVVGYSTSPNSPLKHKIYETSIPLTLLNVTVGQSIDFCSPKKPLGSSISYDDATGRDNPWPDHLVFAVDSGGMIHTDRNTWGILNLAAHPVPEFSAPTTSTLTIAITLVSITLIRYNHKKRSKSNC